MSSMNKVRLFENLNSLPQCLLSVSLPFFSPLVCLVPMSVPDSICDCESALSVGPGRSTSLVTINGTCSFFLFWKCSVDWSYLHHSVSNLYLWIYSGRYYLFFFFFLPILTCKTCLTTWTPEFGDLVRHGYWPGSVGCQTIFFDRCSYYIWRLKGISTWFVKTSLCSNAWPTLRTIWKGKKTKTFFFMTTYEQRSRPHMNREVWDWPIKFVTVISAEICQNWPFWCYLNLSIHHCYTLQP